MPRGGPPAAVIIALQDQRGSGTCTPQKAGWRRGYAPDCKSVKTGSIPVPASISSPPVPYRPQHHDPRVVLVANIAQTTGRNMGSHRPAAMGPICWFYVGNLNTYTKTTDFRDHGSREAVFRRKRCPSRYLAMLFQPPTAAASPWHASCKDLGKCRALPTKRPRNMKFCPRLTTPAHQGTPATWPTGSGSGIAALPRDGVVIRMLVFVVIPKIAR